MININGKEHSYYSCTLEQLLTDLGFKVELVAVELNENIVPKSTYKDVMINDNDYLEVVSFVGGG